MTEKELELTRKLQGLLSGLGLLPEYSVSAVENFNPEQMHELGDLLSFSTDVRAELDKDGDLTMSWEMGTEAYEIPNDLYSGDDEPVVNITEIIVPTAYDKDQLLKGFRYIHNLKGIDSDYRAVNTIMHMYLCPDRIKVNPFKVAKDENNN